ncbi:DUF418 domain-containing protein [Arcanobacterium haemolyticum]|uniref:DUF418 domain-containing protein n=1 Tax=Arcanobacterium haemolyticum TaxID=28264 RepID=UPI001110432F|nr:DUF418 domain-containing protein [Arcanobacterium haemolyticum]QCX46035.1 DUF418 domain-containing protein [Arcanobacterium haemolyticum]
MSKPSRIVGLDVARSLAIIGMITIHMASLLWSTKVMLSGLPASLFAIIAGATMMIIGRNYTSTAFLRLIARGALIILIGLALLPVGGQIQVVLIVMGLVMILVSWMPALGTWWRLGLFIAATIAATVVYAPVDLLIYPLLAWIAYFIGGMLLFDVYLRGRLQRDSGSNTSTNTRLSWIVTAISAVITIIGLYYRFDPNIPSWLRFTGHTGVAGEIILSVAVAAVVIHLCVLIGNLSSTLVYPFAAMGTMSLTVYILHILTAFYWQQNVALHSTLSAIGFIVFFLVAATLWKKFVGQGPAEKLVATAIKAIVPSKKGK